MSLWLIILTVLCVAVLLAVIFVAIGLRRQRDAKAAGASPPPSLESPKPPPHAGGSSGTG